MKETRSTLGFSYHRSIYVSSLFVQKKTLTPIYMWRSKFILYHLLLKDLSSLLKVKLVFFFR